MVVRRAVRVRVVDQVMQLAADHLLFAFETEHAQEGGVAQRGAAVLVDRVEALVGGIDQLAQPGAAFGQRLLGGLALAQVEHGADHAHAAAALVAQHVAAVEHVRPGAVAAAEAVLGRPVRTAALDHREQRLVHGVAVLRMQLLGPPVHARRHVRRIVPERGQQRFVPEDVVVHEVPVPHRVVGRAQHEAQALEGFVQLALARLLSGDVADLDDGALRLAVHQDRRCGERDRVEAAVAMHEHFLALHLRALGEGAVDRAFRPRVGAAVGAGVVHDVVQRASARLLQAVAGERLRGLVHVDALLAFVHLEDRHRRVVEDGVQPARGVRERLFVTLRFGEVQPDADEAGEHPLRVVAGKRLAAEPALAPVGADAELDPQRLPVAPRALAALGEALQILRAPHLAPARLEQRADAAEQPLVAPVGEFHPALGVGDPHQRERVVRHQAKLLLAGAQPLRRAAALGDVGERDRDAAVGQRRGAHLHEAFGPRHRAGLEGDRYAVAEDVAVGALEHAAARFRERVQQSLADHVLAAATEEALGAGAEDGEAPVGVERVEAVGDAVQQDVQVGPAARPLRLVVAHRDAPLADTETFRRPARMRAARWRDVQAFMVAP